MTITCPKCMSEYVMRCLPDSVRCGKCGASLDLKWKCKVKLVSVPTKKGVA